MKCGVRAGALLALGLAVAACETAQTGGNRPEPGVFAPTRSGPEGAPPRQLLGPHGEPGGGGTGERTGGSETG